MRELICFVRQIKSENVNSTTARRRVGVTYSENRQPPKAKRRALSFKENSQSRRKSKEKICEREREREREQFITTELFVRSERSAHKQTVGDKELMSLRQKVAENMR